MSPARISRDHNPLRAPDDLRLPRIAGPCAVVMFGVTGDLARKKLLPAIYDLASRGLLPPGFSLVGFGRRDWSDAEIRQNLRDRNRVGDVRLAALALLPAVRLLCRVVGSVDH